MAKFGRDDLEIRASRKVLNVGRDDVEIAILSWRVDTRGLPFFPFPPHLDPFAPLLTLNHTVARDGCDP